MAFTPVNSTTYTGSGVSSVTLASLGWTVAVGDLIVIGVAISNASSATFTASDSLGNTYTLASSYAVGATSSDQVAIFYSVATHGGASDQITLNFGVSGTYYSVAVSDYRAAGTIALDQVASNHGTGTAVNAGTLALTGSGELVVVMAAIGNNQSSLTPGSGFTVQHSANLNEPYAYEDQVSASGSVGCTLTLVTGSAWSAAAASFSAMASVTPSLVVAGRCLYLGEGDSSRGVSLASRGTGPLSVIMPGTYRYTD